MFTKIELEVLNTLWREDCALTKQEIVELTPDKTWRPRTVDRIVVTLLEKKAIEVAEYKQPDPKHYARAFKASISQEEYIASHLDNVAPNANFAGIFSNLVGKGRVSADTISELRQILDELDESRE